MKAEQLQNCRKLIMENMRLHMIYGKTVSFEELMSQPEKTDK